MAIALSTADRTRTVEQQVRADDDHIPMVDDVRALLIDVRVVLGSLRSARMLPIVAGCAALGELVANVTLP
jgi:hypothetical protein